MSVPRRFEDDDLQREIAERYASGQGCNKLAKEYRTSASTILEIIKRRGIRIRPRGRIPIHPHPDTPPHDVYEPEPKVPWAEILARRATRAPDTRDLTARILGDPRPGESALAKRGAA